MNKYFFILTLSLFAFSCKNEKREEVIIPLLETKKIDTLRSQKNIADSTINDIKKIPVVPVNSNKGTEIKIKKIPAATKATEPTPPSPKEDPKPVLKPESRTNKNEVPGGISEAKKEDKSEKDNIPKVVENTLLQKPDYTLFNELLQKHVSETGKVDYASFKKNILQLENCIAELKKKRQIKIGLKTKNLLIG
jgi:hypothetical protein